MKTLNLPVAYLPCIKPCSFLLYIDAPLWTYTCENSSYTLLVSFLPSLRSPSSLLFRTYTGFTCLFVLFALSTRFFRIGGIRIWYGTLPTTAVSKTSEYHPTGFGSLTSFYITGIINIRVNHMVVSIYATHSYYERIFFIANGRMLRPVCPCNSIPAVMGIVCWEFLYAGLLRYMGLLARKIIHEQDGF